MSARPPGVVHEHAVLCRHLGGVQDRVSRLLQEKETAMNALTSEVVRLRGQLVVARTYVLWGMALPMASVPRRVSASNPPKPQLDSTLSLEAARKAICQTGCVGHAHPWLTDGGQCNKSGRVCDSGGG